jgi:hypothetical protein
MVPRVSCDQASEAVSRRTIEAKEKTREKMRLGMVAPRNEVKTQDLQANGVKHK